MIDAMTAWLDACPCGASWEASTAPTRGTAPGHATCTHGHIRQAIATAEWHGHRAVLVLVLAT